MTFNDSELVAGRCPNAAWRRLLAAGAANGLAPMDVAETVGGRVLGADAESLNVI